MDSSKPLRLTTFALVGALCVAHAGAPAGGKILKLQVRGLRDRSAISLEFVNTGSNPLRVWTNTCSWGHEAMYLEVSGPDGKTTRYEHVPVSWRKNYPQSWLIPAGKSHEIEIQLRRTEWQDLPAVTEPAKIRLVFDVPSSREASDVGAWTGVAKSNWLPEP